MLSRLRLRRLSVRPREMGSDWPSRFDLEISRQQSASLIVTTTTNSHLVFIMAKRKQIKKFATVKRMLNPNDQRL